MSVLQGLELNDALLQALVGEYVAELQKGRAQEAAQRFVERWEGDEEFAGQVRQALAQAIVFSTLACTAQEDEEFEREVQTIAALKDRDLATLRDAVFIAGVRAAVESVGFDHARRLRVGERVLVFEQRARAQ